ncbi:MAG: ATP-binding protein [Gemmatimonadota bacterium]|jgi:two-component system NtrC family sensor kinase
MTVSSHEGGQRPLAHQDLGHFRELFWKTLGRLVLLYFVPLLFLAVFFHLQLRNLSRNSLRAHLEVIAEHQANTFDLFLRERLVNLANVIDDPRFNTFDLDRDLPDLLRALQSTSPAFVDLGVVNRAGLLTHYAGPVAFSDSVDYSNEDWYRNLTELGGNRVITEIYLGFRGQPHFTIAVRRGEGENLRILRSTLSPERLSGYLSTLEGASEVHAAIVNDEGVLQVATATVGEALRPSAFVPPRSPGRGFVPGSHASGVPDYAYARLNETLWALVVIDATPGAGGRILPFPDISAVVTLGLFLIVGVVILFRTRQVVGAQMATEQHEAELSGQLVQAAKLASVGELAGGIAHEINNPLAVIAEEVGVLKDSLDPELAEEDDEPVDLQDHLDAIHDAVFRCRDITRKLLTFVRQTEVKVEAQDLHGILDEVLDTMMGNELAISNVLLERRFDPAVTEIATDRNQLIQVLVNLVKNAIDAMPGGGRLTVTTSLRNERVGISIRDTGHGMPPDHVEKVFMPFFTTKDPGKGTGLGLSVSYTIIRDLGGDFYVESALGKGSVFTIELPMAAGGEPPPARRRLENLSSLTHRSEE